MLRNFRAAPALLGLLVSLGSAHAADASWNGAASAYLYLVPEGTDYLQPTASLDRGRLHLEARYNYEDLETGSLWAGYTLRVDGDVALEFTPMLGGVFGETDGVAPGYRGSVDWRRLSLYSESEYLIDAADRQDSFVYTWSELTAAPTAWFRAGVVVERTRVYETSRDIQRGLLIGVTFERVEIAGHVFNPDDSRPVCVVSISADF